MVTHTRPLESWVACDSCNRRCNATNCRAKTVVIVRRAALDFQGSAVGDASASRDLCDACAERVVAAINKAAKGS